MWDLDWVWGNLVARPGCSVVVYYRAITGWTGSGWRVLQPHTQTYIHTTTKRRSTKRLGVEGWWRPRRLGITCVAGVDAMILGSWSLHLFFFFYVFPFEIPGPLDGHRLLFLSFSFILFPASEIWTAILFVVVVCYIQLLVCLEWTASLLFSDLWI